MEGRAGFPIAARRQVETMARPDRFAPWVVLLVFMFGLWLAMVPKPLRPTPPAQLATAPRARFELPPAPAWPGLSPQADSPHLSLAAVAG